MASRKRKLSQTQQEVMDRITTKEWGAVPDSVKTNTLDSLVNKRLLEYNPDDGTYRLAEVEPEEELELPLLPVVEEEKPEAAGEITLTLDQQILELLATKGQVAARTYYKKTQETTWKAAIVAVAEIAEKHGVELPERKTRKPKEEKTTTSIAKKAAGVVFPFKITREVLNQLSNGCNIRVEQEDGSTFYAVMTGYSGKESKFTDANAREWILPRSEFNDRLKAGSIEIMPAENPKKKETKIMGLSSKMRKILADKPRVEAVFEDGERYFGSLIRYGETAVVVDDQGGRHRYLRPDFDEMVILKQIRVIDQSTAPVAPDEDEEMPPADDRLEQIRADVAQNLAFAKGQLADRMDRLAVDLADKAKVLKATQDDPSSYSGLNMFGEIQDVSQIESLVGKITTLRYVYKQMK